MFDIHCHILPGLDDGAPDWEESIAMARLAAQDGTRGIIATPHQLGRYRTNVGERIRQQTAELNARLAEERIPLQVLPGGDVRIEDDLLPEFRADRVLSLGDHRQHLLLELPHEVYFPLQPVLKQLRSEGLIGILSHPERNRGIQSDPRCLIGLIHEGCLMQVTAGSFLGQFGTAALELSEQMLNQGWIHLVASDGHGTRSRRPRMSQARDRIAQLAGNEIAQCLCETAPGHVFRGEPIPAGPGPKPRVARPNWRRFFARAS